MPMPRPFNPNLVQELHTPNQLGSAEEMSRRSRIGPDGTRIMLIGEAEPQWDNREIYSFTPPVDWKENIRKCEARRREFWKKVSKETFDLLSKYLHKSERLIEI